MVVWKGGNEACYANEHRPDLGTYLWAWMLEDASRSRFERIWAQDHTDAPAARTGGLLEAEEDHRRQVRERHHEGAQVAAHAGIVGRASLFDEVIIARRSVVLAPARPCWGEGPQWHRTLLAHHGNPDEICQKAGEVESGIKKRSMPTKWQINTAM